MMSYLLPIPFPAIFRFSFPLLFVSFTSTSPTGGGGGGTGGWGGSGVSQL